MAFNMPICASPFAPPPLNTRPILGRTLFCAGEFALHGDPFLCEDGTEGDMDIGSYEKYLNKDILDGRKMHSLIKYLILLPDPRICS